MLLTKEDNGFETLSLSVLCCVGIIIKRLLFEPLTAAKSIDKIRKSKLIYGFAH